MTRARRRTARLAVLALLIAACSDEPAKGPTPAPTPAPAPAPTPAPPGPAKPDVAGAIAKGVDYLVRAQNKNGSWGSPASNLWDIYAPVPGSFDTFSVASTALAAAGILEAGQGRPGADEALRRATDFLLERHGVKRITVDTLYNTWAHAYSLSFFARLMAREKDPARRAAFAKAAAEDVDLLRRFEFVDGGWGYYDFDHHTQRPGAGATSFTTATCLLALREAKDQGIEVPQRLVDRGLRLLERCRAGGGAFTYDFDLRYYATMGINKLKGSLARTPACLLAMDAWGKKVPEATARRALDALEKEGRFLQIARKYPYPHETWYQNSGYFCFYGYFYANDLATLLPEAERVKQRARLAGHLVPLQEKDGSFWDYQLYGYHKAYGTGYVLQVLADSR